MPNGNINMDSGQMQSIVHGLSNIHTYSLRTILELRRHERHI